MDISTQEIEAIVKQVLERVKPVAAGQPVSQPAYQPFRTVKSSGYAAAASIQGEDGVFERVEDAVEAAWKAQREWVTKYKVEDRKRFGSVPVPMWRSGAGRLWKRPAWAAMRIR